MKKCQKITERELILAEIRRFWKEKNWGKNVNKKWGAVSCLFFTSFKTCLSQQNKRRHRGRSKVFRRDHSKIPQNVQKSWEIRNIYIHMPCMRIHPFPHAQTRTVGVKIIGEGVVMVGIVRLWRRGGVQHFHRRQRERKPVAVGCHFRDFFLQNLQPNRIIYNLGLVHNLKKEKKNERNI